MQQNRGSFWKRHRWIAVLTVVCLVVVVTLATVLSIIAYRFQPLLHAALVQGLQDRFHTRVELDKFHVALGNGLNGEWGIWATGKGLRIWPPRHTGGDRPLEISVQSIPLISLDEFRFHVPLQYERGKPVKISRVRLAGLKIVVPPRSERDKYTGIESAVTKPKLPPVQAGQVPQHQAATPATPANGTQPAPGSPESSGRVMLSNLIIERIDCESTELVLETDKPDKLPLGFDIARLKLRDVRAGAPMKFEAELTNPKPKGLIRTKGALGPWLADDPGETAVSGAYTFDHADLATFKGIAGILSSTGNYQGTLRDIVVDGKADVPDFRLPQFGNALPLRTRFHAKVDGTDGDTWLEPVDATLGSSHFTTRGKVVRVKPPAAGNAPVATASLPPLADYGHNIELKVDVDRGHIEDFLRLANHAPTPFLTGTLAAHALLHIPPGREPAHRRLRLDGTFKLDDAHFTDQKVQSRIKELSLRGQGRPQEIKHPEADVVSEMEGDFHMADAVISLPAIHYNVPGAAIQLEGKYPLEGFMHFEGRARMQATLSQMVGGWKGWLLKPADRFFRKDGAGTDVPILIRGPHNAPEFSLDFGRMKKTSPETQGEKNRD